MKTDAEKEQNELNVLLDEAAEIRKELSNEEGLKQASSDIGKILKGIGALGFLILMVFMVGNKLSDIKTVNISGWVALGIIFVFGTMVAVKLSNILEKKTNFSENSCMNMSVGIVFIIFGGIVYQFWDSLSQFF